MILIRSASILRVNINVLLDSTQVELFEFVNQAMAVT